VTVARGRQLVVEARPDGRWRISPESAAGGRHLFDSKAAAMAHAQVKAQHAGWVLVVKGSKGRIERTVRHR
jgi:hypothetical protein